MSYLDGRKVTIDRLARMRDHLHEASCIVGNIDSYGPQSHLALARAVELVAGVLQEIVAGDHTDANGRPWVRRET